MQLSVSVLKQQRVAVLIALVLLIAWSMGLFSSQSAQAAQGSRSPGTIPHSDKSTTFACTPPKKITWYSQRKQDSTLYEKYFKGRCGGVFVDIGAYDGKSFSNSLGFEESLLWHGICVEPAPGNFERLITARPKCTRLVGINLNAAIGNENKKVKFLSVTDLEMLNGMYDFMSREHLERIDREVRAQGRDPAKAKKFTEVDMVKIEDVLLSYALPNVDLMSIDVEGAELEVLSAIDFSAVNVHVLTIERNERADKVIALMQKNGFEHAGLVGDIDDVFVNPNYCTKIACA